jgi:hypothetical protein
MSPVEAAIAAFQEQIDSFATAASQVGFAGSSGYFQQRAYVLGQAYLLRVQSLGVEGDVSATERLYKTGTVLLSTTEPK